MGTALTAMPANRAHKRRCPGCDAVFFPVRSDRVTCSDRCRQRYKRKCDAITAETTGAPSAPSIPVPNRPRSGRPDPITPDLVKRVAADVKHLTKRKTSPTRSKPAKKGGKRK